MNEPMFPMRINRYLVLKRHSVSRRNADELIKKRLVSVNGRLAVLGDKIQESDIVKVSFSQKPKPMSSKKRGH